MTSSSRVLRSLAMAGRSCISARTVVMFATVLALAGCGATGGADRPEVGATIMLDGPRAGVHAGIASAIARGYDEAEGVQLRLRRGSATPRTLTTGRADFAVLDLN